MSVRNAGIFWDIENIPIHCAFADKEAEEAVRGMKKLVHDSNHFGDSPNSVKNLKKFVIVARKAGDYEPTPQHCKDQLQAHGVSILMNRKRKRPTNGKNRGSEHKENEEPEPEFGLSAVEVIDLPFSRAKDYCDDEIYRVSKIFAETMTQPLIIFLLTGDKALIRKIHSLSVSFDIVIVIKRGKRDLRNVTGHCRNVRRENLTAPPGIERRLQIYMFEEVLRAGNDPSVMPKNDIEYFAGEGVTDIDTPRRNSRRASGPRSRSNIQADDLEDNHLEVLFRS